MILCNSINSPWPGPHISMCVNLCPNDNGPELYLKKSRQLDLHERLGSTSNEDTKDQRNVPGTAWEMWITTDSMAFFWEVRQGGLPWQD